MPRKARQYLHRLFKTYAHRKQIKETMMSPKAHETMTYPFTSSLPFRASFSSAPVGLTDFCSGSAGSGDCEAMIAIKWV